MVSTMYTVHLVVFYEFGILLFFLNMNVSGVDLTTLSFVFLQTILRLHSDACGRAVSTPYLLRVLCTLCDHWGGVLRGVACATLRRGARRAS